MERLIKYWKDFKQGAIEIRETHSSFEHQALLNEQINMCFSTIKALEQLQEYQHLKEQGLLVELPCKVGDTVYRIASTCTDCEEDCDCCNGGKNFILKDKFSLLMIEISEFGKTVFLTKEEAEKALKEKI